MKIKEGIYRKKLPIESKEIHGGVALVDTAYVFICFILESRTVGFYIAGKDWLKPFKDASFMYKGKIIKADDDRVEFNIFDPVNHDEIIFSGHFVETDSLFLTAHRKSEGSKIWLEDIFEYM